MANRLNLGFLAVLLCLSFDRILSDNVADTIKEAKTFLETENELLRQRSHKATVIAYNYNTNVTEENRQAMISIAIENAKADKELALRIKGLGYDKLKDENIKRQVDDLTRLSFSVLPEEDFEILQNAISSMQSNYATAKVCDFDNPKKCDLNLEPHINERLRNSRNPAELAHYWRSWYDAAGTPMRDNFKTYIELSRKAALLNNFTSNADEWISFYEDPDFEKNLDAVYEAILPLYREIHGYVRYRLREYYGPDVVSAEGNIQMHLLGNMWGQSWEDTIDLYTPFPNRTFINVDSELEAQGISVKKIFELGDDFFKSLGMRELPKSFWNLSVLERPNDREIICHASAWDMYQDSDVRIKMCTEVNTHYLYVVHHELGHIQYYLQYEDQPTVFRGTPNPGFHEAIGDVIALSVASPKHLKTLGLIENGQLDEESRINELFKTALKKIVFLPFSYALDKYRLAVFRGEIDESAWNCGFWKMRSKLTGIEPPFKRTEKDFDPPAKYHVSADVEYLRYFASHIFQFQFHKSLCTKAGQFDESDATKVLDNCDIYGSKKAGKSFSKFLSMGSSKHWKTTLEQFTGDTTMDPSPLLEYFKPLQTWLQAENRRLNVPLGWTITDKITSENCA